jgi:hypothetical protein
MPYSVCCGFQARLSAKRQALSRTLRWRIRAMTKHLVHDTNSRVVRIEALPDPIAIDIAWTAVIVVDMQHDFRAKGGMFDRAGIDLSMIQRAIGPTARVLAAARNTGVQIVYLKMGFVPISRTSVLTTPRTGCGIRGSAVTRGGGRLLVWIFNMEGTLDLIAAIVLATIYGAPAYMGPAYGIPTFWVPALLVTHYITFIGLRKSWTGAA